LPTTSGRKKKPRTTRARKTNPPARAAGPRAAPSDAAPLEVPINWIRPLAQPYLRGYRARPERASGLRGFSFWLKPRRGKGALGIFVGFLIEPGAYAHLKPAPPECLIFAFVEPVDGSLHRAQVLEENGTLRWTFGYIRWLTHRPPRFELYDTERTALIRHASMSAWPADKIKHLAGNFFTETLAWLVRSGLVRRWRELCAASAKKQD